MNPLLLGLPFMIAGFAVLILMATLGANALARRTAQRHAARPRFTLEERERLRALREQYRREPDRR